MTRTLAAAAHAPYIGVRDLTYAKEGRMRVAPPTFFLSSPQNQMQAHAVTGMPVLISFALDAKNTTGWLADYIPSFGAVLVDSGAYSELTGRARVDLVAYVDFMAQCEHFALAMAGLDDIGGDWRRSLENYKAGGFPTIHEADPLELLDELVPLARERGGWIGLGLTPPRQKKEHTVRRILERIPDDLHVHGWACGAYAHVPGFSTLDSTNWWRDYMKVRNQLPWLTPAECQDIVVKRYQRQGKVFRKRRGSPADPAGDLFDNDSTEAA